MITTDTTRMRSTHSASTHCAALVDPALPWSGVATYMPQKALTQEALTQSPEQFGDRTPTTGPPRGASG